MKADQLLLMHIRNLYEKLGLTWHEDMEADVAAIIQLMKKEMAEELNASRANRTDGEDATERFEPPRLVQLLEHPHDQSAWTRYAGF